MAGGLPLLGGEAPLQQPAPGGEHLQRHPGGQQPLLESCGRVLALPGKGCQGILQQLGRQLPFPVLFRQGLPHPGALPSGRGRAGFLPGQALFLPQGGGAVQAGPAGLLLAGGKSRHGEARVRRGQEVPLPSGGQALAQDQRCLGVLGGHQALRQQAGGGFLPGGGQHASHAQPQGDAPLAVRLAAGNLPGGGHVQHGQGHPGPCRRGAIGPGHLHREALCVPVAGGDVLHGHALLDVPVHRVCLGEQEGDLLPAALDKGPGVDHHRAGGGVGEPAPVQLGLGLAGAQVAPALAVKGLHPGVVVVAVGPPGHVHLPGGNAHAAQGRHQKGRFLPAAAKAPLVHLQRRGGAAVGGAVGGLLGAPAVHL